MCGARLTASFLVIWGHLATSAVLADLPGLKPLTDWGKYLVSWERSHQREEIDRAIGALAGIKVVGDSFGGPYVGVDHNHVTRDIVAFGPSAIPALVDRLKKSDVDETIFIVFCLSELQARSAKDQIIALNRSLKERQRFSGVRRDLTLDVQIDFFLRDVESWK